jgi:beta-1,4-mannosyl-glycoprotein beta-1,4-N-acetylglucosaminyltransferase
MFFNELDLLEIRLNELAKVVDYFVIVESHLTFSNKAKPLYYWRERKRFRSFEKQIIHIVVEDMPTGPNPWAREHHQRRALARALVKCQDQDIVIFSDADEIPKASVVASFNPQRGPQALQLMNSIGCAL